jgi:hypothetical protein
MSFARLTGDHSSRADGVEGWLSRLAADRWPTILSVTGSGLLPWALSLGWTIPTTAQVAHWNMAWVGLDLVEATALITAGVMRRRSDPREALALAVASTAITLDAWFDVVTAVSPADRRVALLLLPGELAAAAVAARLAVESLRP